MKKNVGKVDQAIRYILAIVLIVLAVIFQGAWYWLLLPAVILGFTASVSWCGIYRIFGIDTCKFDKGGKND